jgi:hypothetical protein
MENVQSQNSPFLRATEMMTEQVGRMMSLYTEAASAQWHGMQSVAREMNQAASHAMKYSTEVAEIVTKFQTDLVSKWTAPKA